MEEENDSKKIKNRASLLVHINFYKRVWGFIKSYEEKNGISISTTQATKIIDDKIEKTGGLKA